MNGRESRITRIVLSNDDYRKDLFDKIKKSESIVGTKVIVDDKTYKITLGDTKKIDEELIKFKESLKNEYSSY